ncbi:hypothetical protein FQR65_LT16537 [Abscondita terminalis]|nr:hypothetical protein FQR65_LT16537 [Abscondita terminalis]
MAMRWKWIRKKNIVYRTGGDTPVPAREEVVKRASPGSSFSDRGTFVAEDQATLSFIATGQLEMERILDQRMREEKVLAFSRRESLKRTPPEKSKVEEAKNKEDTLDTPFKEMNKKEWDDKPPSTEQTVEDITWTLIKTPEKMVKKRKCLDPSPQSTLFKVEPNLTISKLLQKEKIVKFKNDNKSVHKEIKTGIMEILDLVNKVSKENVKEREEKELLENMLQKADDVLTKKHEELDAVKMENAEVRKKEKETEQKIKRLELKYNEETKNNSEKIRRLQRLLDEAKTMKGGTALQEKINKRLEEKTDFQTFWELKDDLWPEECFNKTNMNSELRQNSINDTKVVMLNLNSWDIENPDITKIFRDKPILAEVAKARELDTGQTINVKNSSQIEIEGLDKENQISPVPVVPQKVLSVRRKVVASSVLTSSEHIHFRKEKLLQQSKKRKLVNTKKEIKVKKLVQTKLDSRKTSKSSSSSEEDVSFSSASEVENMSDYENECAGCGEDYRKTKKSDD